MAARLRALYVCYFGVREPLVQTQVLPYLRELVQGGVRMSLLTFEPERNVRWNAASIARMKAQLLGEGVDWHMLPYHRRPTLPATLYDVVVGAWRASTIARRDGIGIFHGRSHVGGAIAALAKRLVGGRVIFDFRGFLAEEYVESGHWKAGGYLARLVKRAERWLCRRADGFVVLTESAREILFPDGPARGQPIEVIPCCVDLDRFKSVSAVDRATVRNELGIGDRLVFVHAGSIGGAYLARETAAFLAVAREADPRAYALVLTQEAPSALVDELEHAGFSPNDYRVVHAAPAEVPRYLLAADVGLAMVRPGFPRRATSPTKVAEYLAAGLPVVTTAGVGDLDGHIEQTGIGALLHRFDRSACVETLAAIDALRRNPGLGVRCQREARARYDLKAVGGERYRRLYRSLSPARPVRVRALASYPVEAASSRFRIVQYVNALAARDIEVRFSPFLNGPLFAALYRPTRLLSRLPQLGLATVRCFAMSGSAARADAIFVQREAMLFGPPVAEWIAVRLLGRPLVLDLDDPTYLSESSPIYGRLATILKWPGKTDRLIDWSRVVTCGSANVAAYVRSRHRAAEIVPTIVDTHVFRPGCTDRDVPAIGWIGTHSTYPFLERLLPLFERLGRSLRFQLIVVGSGRTDIRVPGVSVETRIWRIDREADDFRSLDVGVYPISDDAWSHGKSGLKAVQYMASGVAFVMSPIGVCAEMGVPGETHFAATTDEEWLIALTRLIADRPLRSRIGHAGRAFAERHFSIDEQADRLASIIRGVL